MRYLATVAAAVMAIASISVPAAAAEPPGDGVPHAGYGVNTATTMSASAVTAAAVPTGYSVRGVDVSHYQGSINWSSAAGAGERFAYLKATEGIAYTDPTFAANHANSKASGMYAGAYHFAWPNRSTGATQADYLLDHAPYAHDGRTLPPMLDIEWPWDGSATCYGLTPAEMVGWIKSFVNRVQERTGVRPTIYTNPNWWNGCTGNTTAFGAYPLFHSNYTGSPGTLPSGWSNWTFWQWTDAGTVAGVSAGVDRDVFRGTADQLAALAGGATPNNDFDGDGVSDIAIYRVAAGQWNLKSVAKDTQLYGQYPYGGIASDIPLTGDFDGDGYTDIALYRQSQGQWHIKSVHDNEVIVGSYPYGGLATDIPVVGDFDGDGYTDIGLYRAATGTWALKSVHKDAQIVGSYAYGGLAEDMPVVGDFDGDGYDDIGLYRHSSGQWALKSVHNDAQIVGSYPYGGLEEDMPVVGDFDGDGYDDIGLYRHSAGQWALKSVHKDAQIVGSYPYGGLATDTPVIGDYDGDGYDDIGLYRAAQGQWALKSVHLNTQIIGSYPYGGAATDTVPTT